MLFIDWYLVYSSYFFLTYRIKEKIIKIINTIIKKIITEFFKDIVNIFYFLIFKRIFSKKQYNNVNKYFDRSSLILNLALPFFLPNQFIPITL